MFIRSFILALAAVAALGACQRAAQPADTPAAETSRAISDPAAVVRQLYDPYLTPNAQFPGFLEQAPWSNSTRTLLQQVMARSEAINEPIIDFDPVIGAQDYQIRDVTTTTESLAEASHATVRASFVNMNARTEIVYDLVWEDDRWKVENIRGDSGGQPWDFRALAQSGLSAAAAP